jgi:hypothetical protein
MAKNHVLSPETVYDISIVGEQFKSVRGAHSIRSSQNRIIMRKDENIPEHNEAAAYLIMNSASELNILVCKKFRSKGSVAVPGMQQ